MAFGTLALGRSTSSGVIARPRQNGGGRGKSTPTLRHTSARARIYRALWRLRYCTLVAAASSQRSRMTMAGSTSPAGVCYRESWPPMRWSAKLGRSAAGWLPSVSYSAALSRSSTPKANAAFFSTPATSGSRSCQRTTRPPSTGSCGFPPRPVQNGCIAPVIAGWPIRGSPMASRRFRPIGRLLSTRDVRILGCADAICSL